MNLIFVINVISVFHVFNENTITILRSLDVKKSKMLKNFKTFC